MSNQRLKLLVIDDNPADVNILRRHLRNLSTMSASLAHCGQTEQLGSLLEENDFDCIFLDYILGSQTGLEVLCDLREQGHQEPIIAFSSQGNEQVAVQALKLGAQDYMVKGQLSPESIERAIRNAMEKVEFARQLAARQQELQEFAHVVAHDLQGPLTSISLWTEVLRHWSEDKAGEQEMRALQGITNSTQRMSRFIDGLLRYATLDYEVSEPESVDLNELAGYVRQNLSARIAATNATLQVGPLPRVSGLPVQLEQLLQNLISNAIKFHGEQPPVITLSATQQGNVWRISIADNGIGIPADKLRQIFAPFRRLHDQNEFDGCGIGLATCRRVVDRHQGELWVESTPGVGSTFHFTLPASLSESAPQAGEELLTV